jgi:molybdopterin synthase sulfur carrier subunit
MAPEARDMTVRLLYFAWVREKLCRAEESVSVPESLRTIADLMRWLAARGPEYADVFSRTGIVRAAIDQTHVHPMASIAGAREIAFFPPVTGG